MRQLFRDPALRLLPLLLCLGLALSLGAPAWSQDDEPRVVVRKVVGSCDGDDCEDGKHVVIELDGDNHFFGNLTEKFPAFGSFELLHSGEGGNVFFFGGEGGGFLGVHLVGLTEALRSHFGVPEGQGVMVSEVTDDSAAWRAGIEAGDIITAVDGTTVSSSNELAAKIRATEPGASVDLEVWRDGQPQTITAQVDANEPRARTRAFFVNCQDDDENCNQVTIKGLNVGCEDDSCNVEVSCTDGDCTCTVNGEARDCESLDHFQWHDRRDFHFRHRQ